MKIIYVEKWLVFSVLGFIQDLGRVFSSSGFWIRNRSSEGSKEFSPLNSFSLPATIIQSTSGVVYVANSTHLSNVQATLSTVFPYVCEFVGKLFCSFLNICAF